MNRLTKTYKDGTHGVSDEWEDRENSYAYKDALIESVGQYEDLGLTPEQIRKVDRLYAEKCREVVELKKSKWIPVTERLPKEYKSVLACDRDGHIDIAWGWYAKDKFKWNNWDDVNCDNIIAWMPLPDPYTESVKE